MQATAFPHRLLRLPSQRLRAASDERLVAELRRGDEQAFEEVYDRHHRAILGFCRHMLGSREEAEDALQHVFVSAHRSLCEGTAAVNLKPWLFTIARNRCLSMLRARRETLALEDVREPSSDGLAPADEAELGENLKEMLGDIARLPVNQRAALVLAELGDLSQHEIAATLDVRTDKVKALIFQAREALGGWREARAASCLEIRQDLATLEGSALRRAPIRRHLAVCPACAAFEGEVKRQRAAFSLLLPVIPSLALKHSVLTAALAGGHGAAAAAGAGAGGAVVAGAAASGAGAGASGLAAKALVVATLAVGAGGGGVVAVRELDQPRPVGRPAAAAPAFPRVAPVVASPVVSQPVVRAAHRRAATVIPAGRRKAGRGRADTAPGHTKAREAKGRGAQRAAERNARLLAEKKPKALKTRPAGATTPATAKTPAAAKTPATKGKAKPPASERGKPVAKAPKG